MAGTGWTESEIQSRLHVRSEQTVRLKLKVVSKNDMVHKVNTRSLTDWIAKKGRGEHGKTEIMTLTAKYRKVKDSNRRSGNSLDSSLIYFEEIDAVLGTRAASELPLLVDSRVPNTTLQMSIVNNNIYIHTNIALLLYVHVNGIKIRSRLANNRIWSTLCKFGYNQNSREQGSRAETLITTKTVRFRITNDKSKEI